MDFNVEEFINKVNPVLNCLELNLFCSHCKDNRLMNVEIWTYKPFNVFTQGPFKSSYPGNNKLSAKNKKKIYIPSFWICICNQCKTYHYLVIFPNENKPKAVLLSDSLSGISTPNTPPPVMYYLDQAFKAKMIGANSACIAMYRSALEQLLFEQGYINGMLNNQIIELTSDKKAGKGKDWTKNIDDDLFDYIKELGNGAIHPNGGDITKQQTLDDNLINNIDELFSEFLEIIYEKPIKDKKRKDLLLSSAKRLSK